ncbi:PREDICTED: callose synthase 1-like [Camelina sativa]|uniref:Callose synthase 1-like n=1 Tax=Camelina sativa TaxID=90675 RepID=A0ABM1Q708_CAMSA|nr:PREDICTED: callose synthase 1-like [Camelina sativa]
MSDILRFPSGGGVLKFNFTLTYWIRRNDETSEQGQFQPHTDLPHLQSFCLDFYEKNIIAVIKIIGNQYTYLKVFSHITDACETARDLFKVLELLSKDIQLPSEILEAHTEVKQLAKFFRPYNIIPCNIFSDDYPSIKRLPELPAAVTALAAYGW